VDFRATQLISRSVMSAAIIVAIIAPPGPITKMSRLPLRDEVKAMSQPSGALADCWSAAGSDVRRRMPLPSAFMT
jgi:hypothetical protein